MASGRMTEDWSRRLLEERRYRQSLLAGFEVCARRTYNSLCLPDDLAVGWVGAAGELGKAMHAVIAEMLRTLWRQGEVQMATQESVEIAYETLIRESIVLPSDERDDLIGMILTFAGREWNPKRFLLIEGAHPAATEEVSLTADIVCPDGVTRTVTGRPDLIVADPPRGIVICDWKSGKGRPRSPQKPPPDGEPIRGKQYLSDRGHFQLDTYGLLGMRRFPSAEYATLQELHLRSGEIREAVLGRDELEHVERQLGLHMMLMEQGAREGAKSKVWKPRPGHQCLKACPVARSCPVPQAQRGVGAVGNEADADKQARRYAVVDAVRQQLRERLKAYHEQTGYAPRVGDGKVMRWRQRETGSRAFGMWDPEVPPADDGELDRQLRESLDARNAA